MTWHRMIALMDMNAFFASVEQLDAPELRGQPIAVTNGHLGSTIITSSYEARRFGIKTGMRLREARRLCPHLIQRPSRPGRFVQVSKAIMTALEDITPDIEVFSVDEAFLDLTGVQQYWHQSPDHLGRHIKQLVIDASGLLCSVGIAGDKTTAKWAAKQNKPDGLTVVHPDDAEAMLADVPVTDLCGIAGGIGRFLANRNVWVCGDMKRIPISALSERFGAPGRRIWLMAQGKDPQAILKGVPDPKSVGAGKVLPPACKDRSVIHTFFQHMSEKVAERLRCNDLEAQTFWVGMRSEHTWLGGKYTTATPTSHGGSIYMLAQALVRDTWSGQAVFQVQVRASDPQPKSMQLDWLAEDVDRVRALDQAMDRINEKFGAGSVFPAKLRNKSSMPDVISPAWKPYGHRDSIS